MSTVNDPRQNRENASSASENEEQMPAKSPGANHNDARSMAANPEENYADQEENTDKEKFESTTDPQEHMEGPISSTAKAIGEEMETDETKQEHEERQDKAL